MPLHVVGFGRIPLVRNDLKRLGSGGNPGSEPEYKHSRIIKAKEIPLLVHLCNNCIKILLLLEGVIFTCQLVVVVFTHAILEYQV